MSTHTYPTTDTQATNTRPTDTRTTEATSDSRATYQPTLDHGEAASDRDADSWVARCQRQFDTRGTDRLRNCIDDENHAMPTPTDP